MKSILAMGPPGWDGEVGDERVARDGHKARRELGDDRRGHHGHDRAATRRRRVVWRRTAVAPSAAAAAAISHGQGEGEGESWCRATGSWATGTRLGGVARMRVSGERRPRGSGA